jgi:rhodanese-related sulfurtransferase
MLDGRKLLARAGIGLIAAGLLYQGIHLLQRSADTGKMAREAVTVSARNTGSSEGGASPGPEAAPEALPPTDREDPPEGKPAAVAVSPKGTGTVTVSVYIPAGVTAAEAAGLLCEKGVIKNAKPLVQALKDRSLTGRIRAGSYRFESPAAEEQIIARLTEQP